MFFYSFYCFFLKKIKYTMAIIPSTTQKSRPDIFRAPNNTRFARRRIIRIAAVGFCRLGGNFNIAQHRPLAEIAADLGSGTEVFFLVTGKEAGKFDNAAVIQLCKTVRDDALLPAARKNFNNCCFFHDEHR